MSDATVAKPPRRRRRGVLALQVLLVLGFLGLFVYAFQSNVLVRRADVPEQVAGLELESKVEGEAAIAQVSQLHGTGIPLQDAFIAKYAHGGSRVTAWVAKSSDAASATELTRRMIEGIKKGGSPFSNLRQQTVSGKQVYQVDGPGGRHYFYTYGERVVWLTLEGSDYQSLLPVAVQAF